MERADFADSLELIRRARGGDQRALGTVLERYRGRLLDRVRLMMGERARREAESGDFLHEVFARVLEHFDGASIADEKQFLRWATAIARNRIRDRVRRRRERVLDSLSATLSGDVHVDRDAPSPSSEADLNNRVHVLVEALEQLDDEARRVIEMHVFDGLSFQAMADTLGWAKTTVRERYDRALVELGRRVRG